ncbi:MAG: hypothetical protein PHD81_01110 [Candidatus Nanoarchaeia archaeon]|nr:hypothetical protein [Candidatus Nanoarchaeia archaeon]MDD5587689.1 hypothetical protein [Candidatus Nanoarchaeia archaeon]
MVEKLDQEMQAELEKLALALGKPISTQTDSEQIASLKGNSTSNLIDNLPWLNNLYQSYTERSISKQADQWEVDLKQINQSNEEILKDPFYISLMSLIKKGETLEGIADILHRPVQEVSTGLNKLKSLKFVKQIHTFMINDEQSIIDPVDLFVFDNVQFLKSLEVYIKSFDNYHPNHEYGERETILGSTFETLEAIINNYKEVVDKIDFGVGIQFSVKQRLQNNLKQNLEKNYHKLKKLRIWTLSYVLENIDGFVSRSLQDIIKDQATLEVVLDMELSPLIQKFIKKDITEDYYKNELSELIERFNIKGVKKRNLIPELKNNLLNYQNLESVKTFYELIKGLPASEVEGTKKQDSPKTIEELFLSFTKKWDLKLDVPTGKLYTGIHQDAFYQLLSHFNNFMNRVDEITVGESPDDYFGAVQYLYKFFDKPLEFKPRTGVCQELNRDKINLQSELHNYKLKLDGKIVSYENMFKQILDKAKKHVDEISKIELVPYDDKF